MFLLKQKLSANSKSNSPPVVLQLYKLHGNWGALCMDGSGTEIGFQYPDVGNVLIDLFKKKQNHYEISPGPTIRIRSYGECAVWSDYFCDHPNENKTLDESSQELLCPEKHKEYVLNLVCQGNGYVLIDNETGMFVTFLSQLEESLQKDFLSLCKKYKV